MEEKIKKIIEDVRPYIVMHGGDVSLVDIKDDIVKIKVAGKCVGCAMADMTFDTMLGGMIKDEIPEVKQIIIEN